MITTKLLKEFTFIFLQFKVINENFYLNKSKMIFKKKYVTNIDAILDVYEIQQTYKNMVLIAFLREGKEINFINMDANFNLNNN